MEKEQTFYQELKAKGYTRRQFLKFCGIMGAMLGLHQTGIAQVVNALQTKPRKPVLWFHFQECTCCSESFLRSSHPLVGQILLEMISLDYSDTLMAASGFQAEEVRTRSMKENWGKYIMIVEGSIPLGNPGYCTIAGHSAKQVFDEAAHGASAIIAWGNCASSGCIQGAYPNPTDTKPVHKIISGKPVINVQGCPPIADVMAGVITYILTFDRLPELDNMGRPVSFYGRRIHDTCYRRPAYDAPDCLSKPSTMKMRKKDTAYIKWVAKDRIHSIRAQSSNGTKGSVTPYNRGTGAFNAPNPDSGTQNPCTITSPTSKDSASKRRPTK